MTAHAPPFRRETALGLNPVRRFGRTRPVATSPAPNASGPTTPLGGVLRLVTAHRYYGAGPGVTRIRVVAWIGLNDHHLWNVTRDRWTQLRYRTGHNELCMMGRCLVAQSYCLADLSMRPANRWIPAGKACKAAIEFTIYLALIFFEEQ